MLVPIGTKIPIELKKKIEKRIKGRFVSISDYIRWLIREDLQNGKNKSRLLGKTKNN